MAEVDVPSRRPGLVVAVAALGSALLVAALTVGFSVSRDDAAPDSSRPTTPAPAVTTTAPVDLSLLPNLRSLTPENVSIEREGTRRDLRFDGTLANVGEGPAEVVPDEQQTCPEGQRHAAQSIYQDGDGDGRFDATADRLTALRPAGCMLFHPDHTHWHLDASASYVLTSAAGAVVVEQPKVSFCLRDNVRVPGVDAPIGNSAYGKCARDRIQGISVGWADVYKADLPGQVLELPRAMPDGVHCLRVSADPLDLLVESDEDDNASVRAIRITGAKVGGAPPESCA